MEECKKYAKNNLIVCADSASAVGQTVKFFPARALGATASEEDAEKQIDLEGNTYFTENRSLINRWNGVNYKTFEEYSSIEKNAKYEKVSLNL